MESTVRCAQHRLVSVICTSVRLWVSGKGAQAAQAGQCPELIITAQHQQGEREVGRQPNTSILLNRRKCWQTKRHFSVLVAQKISASF